MKKKKKERNFIKNLRYKGFYPVSDSKQVLYILYVTVHIIPEDLHL